VLVVHPTYWRREHGSTLAKWGNKLADVDQVNLGVVAANMGEELYLELGFKKLTDIRVEGDAEIPEGIVNGVLRYEPCSPSTNGNSKPCEENLKSEQR
jgi:hypothetical protein